MKKLLGITVLGLLLCSNAYAGWFSKLPVLACVIDGHHITFNLKKYESWEKWKKKKGKLPKLLIMKIRDDEYHFTETVDNDDGTFHRNYWYVNRYTGVIDGTTSYRARRGDDDAIKKILTTQYNWNGTCKGVK